MLETGIYTVSEASRLARVSPSRIRRWLKGYEFRAKGGRRRSPAIWRGQLEALGFRNALGFLDVLEVYCVDAFLNAGVSWATLRQTHSRAQELLKHSHPFCTNQFVPDGKRILVQLHDQDGAWEATRLQGVFDLVIDPLLSNLDFGLNHVPTRWWPRGKGRSVVVDPRRNFGQPSIANHSIPTHILAAASRANDSLEKVALAFEITVDEVEEAIEFENELAEKRRINTMKLGRGEEWSDGGMER